MFGRPLVLMAFLVGTLGPTTAEGASLEVHGGTLSIAQAPGEQTRVRVAAKPGVLLGGKPLYEGAFRFSADSRLWPGTLPGAGAGAGCQAQVPVSCPGAADVDVAFGPGADYIEVAGARTVRLSGGGGRDALVAQDQPAATLDGGDGDDLLRLLGGNAIGDAGDDTIFLSNDGDGHRRATVDCGPGHDHLQYVMFNAKQPPWDVDAASCPPVVVPLVARPHKMGARLPVATPRADGRVKLRLLRATETVHGTLRTGRRANGPGPEGGGSCSRPRPFRAQAHRALTVWLKIKPAIVRRAQHLSGSRGVLCIIKVSGRDAGGETFGGADVIEDDEFAAFFVVGSHYRRCPCGPALQPG